MAGSYLYGWDDANNVWQKLVCNADGKLIIDPSEILENPPTEDEAGKAPQSAWAFDHKADASAHHSRYTDAEAIMSFGNKSKTMSTGSYSTYDVTGVGLLILNVEAGNIVLLGLAGGVEGQMIYCSKFSSNNSLYIYNDHGTPPAENRFWTYAGDVQLMTYNYRIGFWILYHNSRWHVEGPLRSYPTALFQGTPGDGVIDQAPTSNWAFDHNANASAHHVKYTDAEALMARGNNKITLTAGTYTNQNVAGIGIIELDCGGGVINLKGLAGGVNSQMIYCQNTAYSNAINVYHYSLDALLNDRIMTYLSADDLIPANRWGGFWLYRHGDLWFVERLLNI